MSHRAFDGYVAAQTAPGIDGYNTIIRAQSASGVGANGGDLILMSGEGVNRDGYIKLSVDGYDRIVVGSAGAAITATDLITINLTATIIGTASLTAITINGATITATNLVPNDILFDGYNVSPSITQSVMPVSGADGYHLLINAQSSADAFARGGDLLLHSGDGYNGDGDYRDGYVRLFSGTIEQARIVPNKFSMLTGQRVKITHVDAGTDGYVLPNDYLIMVDTTAARQIHLPPNPIEGDIYQIKDKTGTATPNTITVNGNGYNIDGSATYPITANYSAALFVYNGTQWGVL